jgi:uncharacterized protein
MGKKISRRQFLIRTAGSFLTLLGLSSGGYLYSNQIEPRLLDITAMQISHPLIPKNFYGIKIVQFSDTHLGFQYNLNQLETLVNKINSLQPDIICFTGDLLDEPNKFFDIHR